MAIFNSYVCLPEGKSHRQKEGHQGSWISVIVLRFYLVNILLIFQWGFGDINGDIKGFYNQQYVNVFEQ